MHACIHACMHACMHPSILPSIHPYIHEVWTSHPGSTYETQLTNRRSLSQQRGGGEGLVQVIGQLHVLKTERRHTDDTGQPLLQFRPELRLPGVQVRVVRFWQQRHPPRQRHIAFNTSTVTLQMTSYCTWNT